MNFNRHYTNISMEKVCLNWNEFQVVLAASSTFFLNLFKGCKQSHTLIYMRGVSSEDLMAVLDFVYYGETNIPEEKIEAFLDLAKELRLKGLAEESNFTKSNLQHSPDKLVGDTFSPKKEIKVKTENNKRQSVSELSNYSGEVLVSEMTVVVPNQTPAVDFKELDEKIKTMMSRGQTMRKDGIHKNTLCIICGKEGQYVNIREL